MTVAPTEGPGASAALFDGAVNGGALNAVPPPPAGAFDVVWFAGGAGTGAGGIAGAVTGGAGAGDGFTAVTDDSGGTGKVCTGGAVAVGDPAGGNPAGAALGSTDGGAASSWGRAPSAK